MNPFSMPNLTKQSKIFNITNAVERTLSQNNSDSFQKKYGPTNIKKKRCQSRGVSEKIVADVCRRYELSL